MLNILETSRRAGAESLQVIKPIVFIAVKIGIDDSLVKQR